MKSNYCQLLQLLNENDYDILCLSETLLKPDQKILPFPNYNIFRKDAIQGERGIAILIKTSFKSK